MIIIDWNNLTDEQIIQLFTKIKNDYANNVHSTIMIVDNPNTQCIERLTISETNIDLEEFYITGNILFRKTYRIMSDGSKQSMHTEFTLTKV